jgi:FkbM family methyltransferase
MTKLALALVNGTACHFTSELMRPIAKYIAWEIFEQKCYLQPRFDLRPTDTVVDIGGNIGLFALWAAPQVPQGRVLSIEPNPAAFACLQLNIERNALANVTSVHAAAGQEGGTMELLYYPGWEIMTHNSELPPPWFGTESFFSQLFRWFSQIIMSRQHRSFDQARRLTAPRRSLGSIMDAHQIDVVNYLKIDCEGSEYEVLRNIGSSHWARIERVVIAFHEYGRDRLHLELVAILRDAGFEVEVKHSWHEKAINHLLRCNIGMIWARKHSN